MVDGFVTEPADFGDSVRELLKSIEPLLVQVKRCADRGNAVNSLLREKDSKVYELNALLATPEPQRESAREDRLREIAKLTGEIAALPEKIEELHEPFHLTSQNLTSYVTAVQDVLSRVPVNPPQLRDVSLEIKKLPLLTRTLMLGFIPMKDSHQDLLTLKFRLREFLLSQTEKEYADGASNPAATLAVSSPAALIGGWLKRWRESQRSLAGRAGISPNTLRKIMDGKPVHRSKISKVAEVLDCRYEDLLPQ